MVHKTKKKKPKYVVTGISGSMWYPIIEGHLVKSEDVPKILKKFKGRKDIKIVTVQKNGMTYLRGFTYLGEVDVIKRLRKDVPKVQEVVIMEKGKGFFGEPKVKKIIKERE